MLCRSHAESNGHFWWPEEFKNMANLNFENLKHLQKPVHLSLTEHSMYRTISIYLFVSYLSGMKMITSLCQMFILFVTATIIKVTVSIVHV